MSIVSYENVARDFGSFEALKDINLRIDEPCVYGLVGRNGAGKTTLLRMIPCLLHPTQGSLRVFDCDPWAKQDEVIKRLGYLSDEDRWPMLVRARDLIEAHAQLRPKWDRKLETELVNRYRLDPGKRMSAFSKGQRRQIGLICAVCHYPELLVLDEPAGGLDPVARREFLKVVIDLLSETGSTVIFSSHQFEDVQRLANRVGIMHEGRLIADEQLADLQEHSCQAVVAEGGGGGGGRGLADRLRKEAACVRIEPREGLLHLTLRKSPEEAADFLAACGGGEVKHVRAIDLEQLFIDWTGQWS